MEERRHPVPLYIVLGLIGAMIGLSLLFEWMDRWPILEVVVIALFGIAVFVLLIVMAKTHPTDNSPLSRLYRWLYRDPGPYRYLDENGVEEEPVDLFRRR